MKMKMETVKTTGGSFHFMSTEELKDDALWEMSELLEDLSVKTLICVQPICGEENVGHNSIVGVIRNNGQIAPCLFWEQYLSSFANGVDMTKTIEMVKAYFDMVCPGATPVEL